VDADLIVIGAGQAGLAAAYAAERAGHDVLVLDSSDRLGGSWPLYYDSLRLFSPARFSALPWRAFPGDPDRYPGRDEVVEYLSACAADLAADIRLRHKVVSAAREPGGEFRVRGEDGTELRARGLIAASGSFGSPHQPSLPGLDSFAGQVLHANEYRSPASVRGERVVVVGGGNSAVQIAVELARFARVTLAARSRLRWIGQRPLGRDLHWWLTRTGLDTAPLGRWLNAAQPVVDDGSYRAAIAASHPDHRPLFERLDGAKVVWADGEQETVDALILATGYRPHLPYLAGTGALDGDGLPIHSGGVSDAVPGLGFVGLEHQRGISSATIRGVARDAERVVARLPLAGKVPRRRACCARAAYA
jgi:putative flavoprotein involved in K+ transport